MIDGSHGHGTLVALLVLVLASFACYFAGQRAVHEDCTCICGDGS